MVNMNERWVYQGSVTTPPCATNVYWNVVSAVYPIRKATLDAFLKKLALNKTIPKGLPSVAGNFREIQPIAARALYYVSETAASGTGGGNGGAVIGLAVALALVFVACMVVTVMYMGLKKAAGKVVTNVAPTEVDDAARGGSNVQLVADAEK